MKKTFYLFALIGLAVLSCKKDGKSPSKPESAGNEKKYNVNFSIGANELSEMLIKKTGGGLKNTATVDIKALTTYLTYYVYNADNEIVHQLVQDSTTANFGSINDSFTPGTYTIIILATKNKPAEHDSAFVINKGHDMFYKKFNITVINTPQTQNVAMERVVGQLQVKFLDTIPANAYKIVYSASPDHRFSLLNGTSVSTETYSTSKTLVLSNAVKGTTNYTFTTYITNTTAPFKVTANTYDNRDNIISSVEVNNVTCDVNTRTILSGNAYSGATAGFGVTFNEPWKTDSLIIHY